MTPDEFTIIENRLDVGDGHELWLHEWGNKTAWRTFLFLHGGPGSGCSDSHKTLFDGTRDHVIFFDQRGAGKSTPGGSLAANTTQDLIADIEKILDHFGLKQVYIVGGSWGSTLALAYAIAHPERVIAMLVRGIFTSRQTEIDHLDSGLFRNFFPDVWEAYLERTPAEHRANPTAYHVPRAVGDDMAAAADAAYALSEMEGSLISLDDRHKPEDRAAFNPNGARIEAHYLQNHCFMDEGYIMANAPKLTMPIYIVQGRYDFVCPPVTAYELHKRLPNSSLQLTIAGHAATDRNTFEAQRAIISGLAKA